MHDCMQMMDKEHAMELSSMDQKAMELDIKNQLDDWKCKTDSDDYEELMHEQSEEGTAPDNDGVSDLDHCESFQYETPKVCEEGSSLQIKQCGSLLQP